MRFDGWRSSDTDGTIETWAWDFGDGSAPGSGVEVFHTYDNPGTYLVTLTVTDNDGGIATNSREVTVISGTEPAQLPVSVRAVGGGSATKNNIIDVVAATGAQQLATYWAASGSNAVSWFTIDLGSTRQVTQLRLAPRQDRAFAFRVTVSNTLSGNKASGPQTATCPTANIGVTQPTSLTDCNLPSGVFGRYITVQSDLTYIRMYGFEAYGR